MHVANARVVWVPPLVGFELLGWDSKNWIQI
jgi:hypothetical protein